MPTYFLKRLRVRDSLMEDNPFNSFHIKPYYLLYVFLHSLLKINEQTHFIFHF